MQRVIRTTVSKNKRRYQDSGFDLDLTYITPNLIAMGYPAKHLEAFYRNDIKDVVNFFNSKHENNYRIYHLCSEKTLDESQFSGLVRKFPFDDHQPPKFLQFLTVTKDAKDYLLNGEKLSDQRIIAINCKAGKGRTGVMICACLIALGIKTNPLEALNFYGRGRTFDGQGVTIPSQRRYVLYFGHLLNLQKSTLSLPNARKQEDLFYRPLEIQIISIEFLYSDPNHSKKKIQDVSKKFIINNHHTRLQDNGDITSETLVYNLNLEHEIALQNSVQYSFHSNPINLAGDVDFQCKGSFKDLFRFSFNTFFVIYPCSMFKFAAKRSEFHSENHKLNLSRQPSRIKNSSRDENTLKLHIPERRISLTESIQEEPNESVDKTNGIQCNCNINSNTRPDIESQIEKIKADNCTVVRGDNNATVHDHELVLSSKELDSFDHHNLSDISVKITFQCSHKTCSLASKIASEGKIDVEPMKAELKTVISSRDQFSSHSSSDDSDHLLTSC